MARLRYIFGKENNLILHTGWMELLRLPDRCTIPGRAAGWGCQRLVHASILPSTSRLQTGQILEVSQWHPDNHGQHGGRLVQPDLRPLHYHLHLCCDGHATLWQRLHWQSLWKVGLRTAPMELHGLHAQFHDCVQSPLWGVDRIHVGLYVCGWAHLCTLFFGYRPRRKSRHP